MKTTELVWFGIQCAIYGCAFYLFLSTRNWKTIKRYWLTKLTGNVKWYCHWCYREQNDPTYTYYREMVGICEHCVWLSGTNCHNETNSWKDLYGPVRELGLHKEGE